MSQNYLGNSSNSVTKLLGRAPAPLALKVIGTERDGQVVQVHSPKCLVGSSPNAQLRLLAADVLPQHCVVYQGKRGIAVKALSKDTRVNGSAVAESFLTPGDNLSIGSLSFEVLEGRPKLADPKQASSEEVGQAVRAQRRRANRRIRGLLDVVRDQQSGFSRLQEQLDEAQVLVDSLTSREAEYNETIQSSDQKVRQELASSRKRRNQRVRSLIQYVRELIEDNAQQRTELCEQLSLQQDQVQQVRKELNQCFESMETEATQREQLEVQLYETEENVAKLRQQVQEQEARGKWLEDRWLTARNNGRTRVKSLLAHLRTARTEASAAEGGSVDPTDEIACRLTEMRISYEENHQELIEHRQRLKDTESELAWTEQELELREQQIVELTNNLRKLESGSIEVRDTPQPNEPAADASTTHQQMSGSEREEYQALLAELKQQTELAENLQEELQQLRQQQQQVEVEESVLESTYQEESATEPHDPPINSTTGLSSFPNFQFPEDDPSSESEQDSSGAESQHEVESYEIASEPGPQEEEEESIDSYMQNLLQRMRGQQGASETAYGKTCPLPQGKQPEKPVAEPKQVQPITDGEYVPSQHAPEQTSDIRKLRELANETAHAAINSATLSRWEAVCKSKFLVSACGLITGIGLHVMSPSYFSVTFAGACLAYVVTVFWWLQSAVLFQHLKSQRKSKIEQRFQEEIVDAHKPATERETKEK